MCELMDVGIERQQNSQSASKEPGRAMEERRRSEISIAIPERESEMEAAALPRHERSAGQRLSPMWKTKSRIVPWEKW
jgi:hypothetical protein